LSIQDKSSDEPKSFQGQGGVDLRKIHTDNEAVTITSDDEAE